MDSPVLIKNRYEVKNVLGRGRTGVVYQAFDTVTQREVAVKALRGLANGGSADLFLRECGVLTAMVHPNIVEIFDMGQFEEDGAAKPYFAMPLLAGRTLHDLIYPAAKPLPPERGADIIAHACRGLHAAHECGLLHRDIKPRHIFVMAGDAVKLMDFGVVRLLGGQTPGGLGGFGTLHYMAPEQIAKKEATARSDIFSLATVCYEALTAVQPFVRHSEAETAAAVTQHVPALASVLNPLVSKPLAEALAQAMAKDPRDRFESAAAFADALQRSARNERTASAPALQSNPQDRVARARRSFARGDYEFTHEILEQLAAEGVDDPELRELLAQVDEAARKREAEAHLDNARRYFQEEEYSLALRHVSEVLEASPANQAVLSLRQQIEGKLNEQYAAESLGRANAHLEVGEFPEGRRALQDLLHKQPDNAEAKRLLEETALKERDWPGQRLEQETLFQKAQDAYFQGSVGQALGSLQELMELTRRSKAAGARAADYRELYNSVRANCEALETTLADARKILAHDDLEGAQMLCDRLRERYAKEKEVVALSSEIAARRLRREEEFRRGISQRVANEPDLNSQLHILHQAARSRPNDEYFQAERQRVQGKLQQVTDLAERAQAYESAANFDHAMEEWLCVGDIYPAFPGLSEHLARVKGLWQAQRSKGLQQLDSAVADAIRQGDQKRAQQLLATAQAEFQDDAGYQDIKERYQAAAAAHRESAFLLGSIQQAENERRFGEIPALCQQTAALSKEIVPLRARAFDAMAGTASRVKAHDWRAAKQMLEVAAQIGSVPPELSEAVANAEREEQIGGILAEEHANVADLETYYGRVSALLVQYPGEARLEERLGALDAMLADKRKEDEKNVCASELVRLKHELGDATDHHRLWETHLRAKNLAAPFADDPSVARLVDDIGEQVSLFENGAEALSRDRIKDCYEICDGMLARRPGHQLFLQLKDQADVRNRELGDEYFARVERWLMSEPDIGNRQRIIEKAQNEYPFETRYADELRQIEREKAQAEAVSARARDFEKRGLLAEAVGQWRQLRNIHGSYPGLEERLAACESALDAQQRKARAQRLFAQSQEHFANGQFEEGYETLAEAARNGQEVPDLLRPVAPDLVASARTVLPANPKLADDMVTLAQQLDDGLRVPKDLRAKIADARKAEDLAQCLNAIQEHENSADFGSALALADEFLAKFPGVKQVEALRGRLALEIEKERQEQKRAQALNDFHEIEKHAAEASAPELADMAKAVQEIAGYNAGEEDVTQRAATLEALFTELARVREHAQAGALDLVDASCAKAFESFPEHPLFKAALLEAAEQRAEIARQHVEQVKQRIAAENDLSKQAAILREAAAKYPAESYLTQELLSLTAKQRGLNAQIENARALEGKQLFGEAIREWEALRRAYPWYPGVDAEVERLQSARRKEKQNALDRWFRQVEDAINAGDYDTASTMIRQARQQQPERALQGLEQQLKDGLRKKQDSDAQFADGKRLLADGDLKEGGRALYLAYEGQPNDKEKTDAIVLLLTMQIRAHAANDPAACESLLSYVNRIRPGHVPPPDLGGEAPKKIPLADSGRARTSKMLEQLASLAGEAEAARTKKTLSSVATKVYDGGLLNSSDTEVRRTASDLLRKINARLSDLESPEKAGGRWEKAGGIAAGALLVLTIGGAVFFASRTREQAVPVQVSVTPDHASIEIDGQACESPECKFQLKPGKYVVHIQKAGFKPRSIFVSVNSGDSTPLKLNAALEPLVAPVAAVSSPPARLEIRGALPGTRIKLDGDDMGAASVEGVFLLQVPAGTHTLDLSLDGFSNRTIKRDFARGETVSLADAAVQLKPRIIGSRQP